MGRDRVKVGEGARNEVSSQSQNQCLICFSKIHLFTLVIIK